MQIAFTITFTSEKKDFVLLKLHVRFTIIFSIYFIDIKFNCLSKYIFIFEYLHVLHYTRACVQKSYASLRDSN